MNGFNSCKENSQSNRGKEKRGTSQSRCPAEIQLAYASEASVYLSLGRGRGTLNFEPADVQDSPAACINAYKVVGPTKLHPRLLSSLLKAMDSAVFAKSIKLHESTSWGMIVVAMADSIALGSANGAFRTPVERKGH